MKIIHVNCGWRIMKVDHCSYRRNFCSCEKKAWKKIFSFRNCKSCVYDCDDLLSYNSSPRSSHIYDFHIFITASSSFHGFIMNKFNDLFPVGLLLSPSLSMIYSSPRSSHIWFSYIHDFMIILLRVYNQPIQQSARSWLVSSIDRALHWYRKGQAFESCTSHFFFRLSFRNCKSCVYNCNDLLSYNTIN